MNLEISSERFLYGNFQSKIQDINMETENNLIRDFEKECGRYLDAEK